MATNPYSHFTDEQLEDTRQLLDRLTVIGRAHQSDPERHDAADAPGGSRCGAASRPRRRRRRGDDGAPVPGVLQGPPRERADMPRSRRMS
mmetsp:Transcript_5437/g.16863  ORF Transcript_5437/g.16863 Transcript_5437/m.16863 type:complete len:90 (+) Transcript_5437:1407-1676(+)